MPQFSNSSVSWRKAGRNLPVYLLLVVVSLLVVVPFYWLFTTSFKQPTKVFEFPPQWFPTDLTLDNYRRVFEQQPFLRYFWNSLYIALSVTVGTCLLASLAGYAFARLRFPLRNTIFLVLLTSLMIPTEVTSIPLFLGLSSLGLANTHFPLIVPPMLGAGGILGVFMLRQFYLTMPGELDEAARLDGCTPWGIWWRIMLPQSGAAVAALAIFSFLHSWNEFFEPLIYLSSKELYTLPLALSLFSDQSGTEWSLVMAASVLAVLPLLVVFFLAQRRFIEGAALSGLK